MKTPSCTLIAILFTGVILSGTQAAVLGYMENFDDATLGDVVPSGWTENGSAPLSNATIVTTGSDQGYQFILSGATHLNSTVDITDASPSSFMVSVSFTITSMAANPSAFSNINLIALSNTTDGSTGYRLGYNIGNTDRGRLSLGEHGTSGLTTTTSTTTLTPTVNVLYTMTLTGAYVSGAFNFTASLTNGTDTINLSATDPSARTDATRFGFRTASNNAANSSTVVFDDFSVSIPEPASAALVGLGLLGTLIRHRQK